MPEPRNTAASKISSDSIRFYDNSDFKSPCESWRFCCSFICLFLCSCFCLCFFGFVLFVFLSFFSPLRQFYAILTSQQ